MKYNLEKQRLLEAEFILLCYDVYVKKHSITATLYFFEAICQLGDFSQVHVQRLIQLGMRAPMPTKRQLARVLVESKEYKAAEVAAILGYSKKYIYELVRSLTDKPYRPHFIRDLKEKDYDVINCLIEQLHWIQTLGLKNTRRKENSLDYLRKGRSFD